MWSCLHPRRGRVLTYCEPGASVETSIVSAVFGEKTMEASHSAIDIEVIRAGRPRIEYSDILICGKLGGFWPFAQSS